MFRLLLDGDVLFAIALGISISVGIYVFSPAPGWSNPVRNPRQQSNSGEK